MTERRRRSRLGFGATGPAGLALLGALASVGCDGRPKTSSTHVASPPRSGPEVAILDLSDGAPEVEASGFLGVSVHRASFDRFVREVSEVAKDEDVRGVFVRFGEGHERQMGLARAQEIGDLLAPLRQSGKPVFCHADAFTNATLYTAARACSKIWAAPAGDVEAIGMAAQVVYFHKLLADELHLTIDFLQVGKFKGAEESFTRDGPSDEARASLEGTLADLRLAWLDGLKKGRGHDEVEALVEDGPYSPASAKAKGLIDEVGYADDALASKRGRPPAQCATRFASGAGPHGAMTTSAISCESWQGRAGRRPRSRSSARPAPSACRRAEARLAATRGSPSAKCRDSSRAPRKTMP